MTIRWWVLPALLPWVAAGGLAEVDSNRSFDHYKVIIERSPFQRGPSAPAQPAQTAIQGLMLTGFYFESAQKKVWIRDMKTNLSHYVGEGETVLGFRVEKIDPDSQTVTLSQGVESQTLTFPQRPVQAITSAAVTPVSGYRGPVRPLLPAQTVPPGMNPAAVPAVTPAPAAPTSLRRRILRQQTAPEQPEPAPAEGAATDANLGEENPEAVLTE